MYTSWVEVSKSALLHNLKQYQRVVGKNILVMPIIKSNAYGHGMIGVAKVVASSVEWVGVANAAEALELRRHGIKKNILILSYAVPEVLDQVIKKNITLPVYTLSFARRISKIAQQLKKIARVHIKVDTGTSRVGFSINEVVAAVRQIGQLPNITVEGIWSHFAASEENQALTNQQLLKFNQVLVQLEKKNIDISLKHFACSAATITAPTAHFDMVRLGLSLYGLWPSEQTRKIASRQYPWLILRPALTWKTKVIQVKTVPTGTKISYGGTFTTKKPTKIAVLAVGYWEGFDRSLSNRGVVLIGSKRCPVLGRVCMNLTMVDVTKIKNVKPGDEVVLIGQQGRGVITADELAEKIGTINYEVITRINPQLSRVYVK